MTEVSAFLAALGGTVVLTLLFMPAAPRFGLLDQPTVRKTHELPVPAVGGIAMGMAFIGCILVLRLDGGVLWLLAATLVVLAGGVADDRRDLRSTVKFGFQIVAAFLVAVPGGAVLGHLGGLITAQQLALGAIAVPFTVFAIVGVMNAVNMADGADGLAGGLALVATFWFGVAAAAAGRATEFQIACVLAGLLVGFLVFNARLPGRRRARVFMGDAGSYFLGLVLAWLAIRLSMGNAPALAPMTAVWILGIPLADTVVLLVRRMLRRRSPLAADREHLHDLLRSRGYTHGQISSLVVAVALFMGAAALVAERLGTPEHVLFYVYGALWLAYYAATSRALRRRVEA